MNKTTSIFISIIFFIILVIVITHDGSTPKNSSPAYENTAEQDSQNVTLKDGVQRITINAKDGYFPEKTTAKAGIPTTLQIVTENTYDCSSSLLIHSIGYQKILTPTGVTEISLAAQEIGKTLQGTCGMGMYRFQITFI